MEACYSELIQQEVGKLNCAQYREIQWNSMHFSKYEIPIFPQVPQRL